MRKLNMRTWIQSSVRFLGFAVLGLALTSPVTAKAVEQVEPIAKKGAVQRPARQGGGQNQPGQARAGALMQKMHEILESLNLSADQKTQVQAILGEAKSKGESLRDELKDATPQERTTKMREVMQGVQKEIAAVLTEQQKAEFEKKLEEARAEMRQQAGANGAAGGPGARGGIIVQLILEHEKDLGITEDQKQKLIALSDETREKLQAIRSEVKGDREAIRTKAQSLIQSTREKAREILTQDQMKKVRELMQAQRQENAGGPTTQPDNGPRRPGGLRKAPADGEKNNPPPKDEARSNERTDASSPPIGQQMSFKLSKLDGTTAQLSSFKGQIVVLMFGSYTCPVFRDHAAAFDQLARDYSTKARFLIVYTKEAHPTGGWEVSRNKEEGIAIPQTENEKQRQANARMTKEKLNIATTIAVDSMDNAVTDLFQLFPNGTAVLSREGKLFALQKWTDPAGLRPLIDQAVAIKLPPTTAAN